RAGQSQPFDLQLHRILEHRQVADPPCRAVVDRRDRLTTAAAAANLIGLRRQLQHQPATLSTPLMPPILDPIPHPATELGNTIPVGHGRPQFVALDISKSAGSAVRLSLSWEKNLTFTRAVILRWELFRSHVSDWAM